MSRHYHHQHHPNVTTRSYDCSRDSKSTTREPAKQKHNRRVGYISLSPRCFKKHELIGSVIRCQECVDSRYHEASLCADEGTPQTRKHDARLAFALLAVEQGVLWQVRGES